MVDNYGTIKEMKDYADKNNVPIMTDEGISYLTNYIINNQIQEILEIGTAIGYSAIMMALTNPNVRITSIERDEKRYLEAIKNIKKLKLEDRINLLYNDALEVKIEDKFDLIFIDAAKAQNIKFFEKFEKNLNPTGAIITDNLKFHGLVKNKDLIKSKNVRGIVNKIEKYIEYLKENKTYITKFYDIGDGLSVSFKRNEKKQNID